MISYISEVCSFTWKLFSKEDVLALCLDPANCFFFGLFVFLSCFFHLGVKVVYNISLSVKTRFTGAQLNCETKIP